MKRVQKKKGITLIALVITIVIMLLLAGVAIQMSLGENGIIAKSTQAKKEQAKAELYEVAKMEYLNLKTKALEKGEPNPEAEKILSETNFLNKYNVVGDNITDKKGEVIDTKENLINMLSGDIVSFEYKPVIPNEDKKKLMFQVNVKKQTNFSIALEPNVFIQTMKIELPDGTVKNVANGWGELHRETLNSGTYIFKFEDISAVNTKYSGLVIDSTGGDVSIDILNWGENPYQTSNITLNKVNKIYYPETDNLVVKYRNAVFNNIPKDLFSKKTTTKLSSSFESCNNITEIPKDLFKNSINIEYFNSTFLNCENIREIPEDLFKYNSKVKFFHQTFKGYKGEEIPENLFKYNVDTNLFYEVFRNSNVTTIPENLFKYNINTTRIMGVFTNSKISNIPNNLFKYNINVTDFSDIFSETEITSIPEELFRNNLKVLVFERAFNSCKRLATIPENLFKYNNLAKNMGAVLRETAITTIPENLFANNPNIVDISYAFQDCKNITFIPQSIIDKANSVSTHYLTFNGCTTASNYLSLPQSLR